MGDPDPKMIKQLLVELRDVNKERRRTAVMKLGMVGGDEAVRALMGAVQNDHEDLIVRGRAALMLGKIGDSRAVYPLLLRCPWTPDSALRGGSIGQIGRSPRHRAAADVGGARPG